MRYTVHIDELFAMRQKNTNDSCKLDVCDTQQTTHSDELSTMRNYNTDGYYSKFMCDSLRTKNFEKCKTSCLRWLGVSHMMRLRVLMCDD